MYIVNERDLLYRERYHTLGRDATFPWSRALTHPEVKLNSSPGHPRSHTRGHTPEVVMAAILDFVTSFKLKRGHTTSNCKYKNFELLFVLL